MARWTGSLPGRVSGYPKSCNLGPRHRDGRQPPLPAGPDAQRSLSRAANLKSRKKYIAPKGIEPGIGTLNLLIAKYHFVGLLPVSLKGNRFRPGGAVAGSGPRPGPAAARRRRSVVPASRRQLVTGPKWSGPAAVHTTPSRPGARLAGPSIWNPDHLTKTIDIHLYTWYIHVYT